MQDCGKKIPQVWAGTHVAYPIDQGRIIQSTFQQTSFTAVGNVYAIVDGIVVANGYDIQRGHLLAVAFLKDGDSKYYIYVYQNLKAHAQLELGQTIQANQIVGAVREEKTPHFSMEVSLAILRDGKPHWSGRSSDDRTKQFDAVEFFHLPSIYVKGNRVAVKNIKEACETVPNELKGNSNIEQAWNFFIQQGITREGAAGIIGNLLVESQLDPLAGEVGGSGGGKGIAQWGNCGSASNGAYAGCRWHELLQWAAKHQANPDLLATQLAYIIYEMEIYQMLQYFRQTKIIYLDSGGYGGGAVGYFAEKFERPDVRLAHMTQRSEYATQVYSKYATSS